MKNKVILRLTREILLAFHIDKRAATLALEGEVFVSAGKIRYRYRYRFIKDSYSSL